MNWDIKLFTITMISLIFLIGALLLYANSEMISIDFIKRLVHPKKKEILS